MVQYIVNFTDPERTPFNVQSFTTDGPVAPNTLQLSSSAVKATTSLLLYGKGHAEYGERIQENLINLMENFSGASTPKYPISGQTWFARITYVAINMPGAGSPNTATIYKWTDDSTNVNGGAWTALTATTSNPTTANQVKVGGTRPTTVVDGSFWLDTAGSPPANQLYLGVNNASSNHSASFLAREMDDLSGVATSDDLTSGRYVPQKQLKVFDGVRWKNSGNVYTSDYAPRRPAEGDLWFNTSQNDVGSPSGGSPAGSQAQNQLYIWESGQWRSTGYVDTGGDVMTGTLQFGLPDSSLFLWENKGNSTAGSDIRFVGDGVLSSNDNLHFIIDNDHSDAGAGNNVFRVAHGSQNAGSPQRPLFEVLNNGIIRSALATGSPNEYRQLIFNTSDDNILVNKAYVDVVSGDLGDLIARVTANENNIDALVGTGTGEFTGGGSPIPAKVNRAGDTMYGPLVIDLDLGGYANSIHGGSPLPAGSPLLFLASLSAIDVSLHKITNLALPTSPEDAANKAYVDDQIDLITSAFGSPIIDIYASSLTTDWVNAKTIELTRTDGTVLNASLDHNHASADITHEATTPFLRDTFQETVFGSPLFGSPIDGFPLNVSQNSINSIALENLHTRLATIEAPLGREVLMVGVGSPLTSGGSPTLNLTTFSLTSELYVAGTNRLFVYVNGVKQYANERAWQKILFQSGIGLSKSSRTRLDADTTYTLDIAVDGAAASTMTALGNALQTFEDIIDQINTQIPEVTAVWSDTPASIFVYSNTTGTGSQITITDGVGSPLPGGSPNVSSLLTALASIIIPGVGSPTPGLGSPIGNTTAYTIGNVWPAPNGPISQITRNMAYFEAATGSPTIDAKYGELADTIVFNSPLSVEDVVEFITMPVS